jgi:hypothetical protein
MFNRIIRWLKGPAPSVKTEEAEKPSVPYSPSSELKKDKEEEDTNIPSHVRNDVNLYRKLSDIKSAAVKHGWKEIAFQPANKMISFTKKFPVEGVVRLNFYYTTGTVGTCMNHPTKGKTQLFRKNLGRSQMLKLFENPRMHTARGYYQKPRRKKS